MKTKKRILYYDMLNIAACIAVIALHHNGLVHVFTGDSVWTVSYTHLTLPTIYSV